jgi:hypothetical protein
MVFRRTGREEQEEVDEDDEDGLNVVSDDDEEDEDDGDEEIFSPGDTCSRCETERGRVGLDPTCHGVYGGEDGPVLFGYDCLPQGLTEAYEKTEGIGVIIEPFGHNKFHLYYRLDEMPAYQFCRQDVEAISWLMLTLGDACSRCGEQSHFAWLTKAFVDPELPEDEDTPVFRNLDGNFERLCRSCTAKALTASYKAMNLPLMTVELPRSAMGVMMPSGA